MGVVLSFSLRPRCIFRVKDIETGYVSLKDLNSPCWQLGVDCLVGLSGTESDAVTAGVTLTDVCLLKAPHVKLKILFVVIFDRLNIQNSSACVIAKIQFIN